jgi:hypothetical protein
MQDAGGRRRGENVRVIVAIDESGKFAGPDRGKVGVGVLAGVVYPESQIDQIAAFVSDRCAQWNQTEFKGPKLSTERVIEVCEFMSSNDVRVVAHVTDSTLMTPDAVAH